MSDTGVKVHVEEEKSRDGEGNHANENVGYMALWDNCFAGKKFLFFIEEKEQLVKTSIIRDKILKAQSQI